jgi:hypothetical protein
MLCKKCGNQKHFQSVITYYEPVEIWEFENGAGLTRYNQPETGDLEVKLSCPVCNSEEIDLQGFALRSFVEQPLNRLNETQWVEKINAIEKAKPVS